MNEIITKLDEIEKKAESILTEAAAEKESDANGNILQSH